MTLRSLRRILIPAAAALCVSGARASAAPRAPARQGQSSDVVKHEVDSAITALMKAAKIAGVSVAVVSPGPNGALTARTFSYGSTAQISGKPVTSATLFEIGSETKVFTATLLASFMGEGRVALSDPLQKYLPAGVRAPGFGSTPITLLDLATHRSALPRMPSNIGSGPRARANYSPKALYDFLNHYTLTRAPGAEYEYSNLGFGLLGHVLAILAGTDYETLVVQRIATPLDMPDTRVALTAAQRARLATGYTETGAVATEWNNSGAIAGGGGLISNADDEARFLIACIDPAHSPIGAALEETQRLHRYTQQPRTVTGLAWEHIARNAAFPHEILWKNGGTAGFFSWMGFARDTKTGVVLLINHANGTSLAGVGPDLLRLISRGAGPE